jgi:2-polyprenyl-3-methyl-5-hydroxy-6-metoxy-1,4-benzoquinol methylase
MVILFSLYPTRRQIIRHSTEVERIFATPEIPPLIDLELLALSISDQTLHIWKPSDPIIIKTNLWATIWPSCYLLSEIVLQLDLHEHRVVDLGCGIGITCLVSSLRGASVLGLDYTAECLEIAQKNNINRKNVEFRNFNWFHPISESLRGYDLLIGGDVLYMRNSIKPIINCVQCMIKEDGIAIFVDPGRPSVSDFVEECADLLNCVVYEKLQHKPNLGNHDIIIPKAIVVLVMKTKSPLLDPITQYLESMGFHLQ